MFPASRLAGCRSVPRARDLSYRRGGERAPWVAPRKGDDLSYPAPRPICPWAGAWMPDALPQPLGIAFIWNKGVLAVVYSLNRARKCLPRRVRARTTVQENY